LFLWARAIMGASAVALALRYPFHLPIEEKTGEAQVA
jgi:hypothetical protein